MKASKRLVIIAAGVTPVLMLTAAAGAASAPAPVKPAHLASFAASLPLRDFGTGSSFCQSATGFKAAGPLSSDVSFAGVYPCGPIPNNVTETFGVPAVHHAYASFFEYPGRDAGFQCVELANRFLWVAYGVKPISGSDLDGYNYVSTEVGPGAMHRLPVSDLVHNGTHVPYLPGDVVSFSGFHGAGHVAIVTKSTYKPGDNGSYQVDLMEEDASAGGRTTVQVTDWSMQDPPGTDVHPYEFLDLAPRWSAAAVPQMSGATGLCTGGLGSCGPTIACASPTACAAAITYSEEPAGIDRAAIAWGYQSTWHTQAVQLPANAAASKFSTLSSVACATPTECVAVGSYRNAANEDQGMLVSGSGSTWHAAAAPVPHGGKVGPGTLQSVACAQGGPCVAAGWYTASTGYSAPLLLQGSGSHWQPVPVQAPASSIGSATLNSVTCAATLSCVAVGDYYNGQQDNDFLISGPPWKPPTLSPLPEGSDGSEPAGTAACLSAGHCLVPVAYSTPGFSGERGELLSGYRTWTAVRLLVPPGGKTGSANSWSVACSASSCLAGGWYTAAGTERALTEAGQGTSWTPAAAPLPAAASGQSTVFHVACASGGLCAATGYYQQSGNEEALLLSGNGTAMFQAPAPAPYDTYWDNGDYSVTCASAPVFASTCAIEGPAVGAPTDSILWIAG